MEYRSSSSHLGLWVVRKQWRVPSPKGNNSFEGDCPPSLGPDRSASLPGKTQGLGASLVALISDPEIELVDSALALEARPFPGHGVHDKTTIGNIDYPIALIACGAH